jgi:RNA polymerase sigma factor (sigma-70 family)
MHNQSDAELIEMLRKGDKEALATLFSRYYDTLLHYGCRITTRESLVEECIQELFVYIYESHARLGEIQHVKAYLYRSLQRRIIKTLDQERKRTSLREEDFHAIQYLFVEEDYLLEKQQLRQALTAALNDLPWQQREAIYLRYYNNLSTREIAEIMDIANQTVLNTLYLALKKIRSSFSLPELVILFLPLAQFTLP